MGGFTEIPTGGMPSIVHTTGGGGYGGCGYGGAGCGMGFGGTALAAGAGAVLGDLLLGNRRGYDGNCGGNCGGGYPMAYPVPMPGYGYDNDKGCYCCCPATCEQVNDVDRDVLRSSNDVDRDVLKTGFDLQKDLCCCCNETNMNVLESKYDTELQICGLGKDIMCGNYQLSAQLAENKFDNALQLCNMQHEMDKCCCKTNENIMVMGFQTQLRDMENQNCTNKQLGEIKCLIENTAKDGRIEALEGKLCEMSQCAQTRQIQDCICNTFGKTSSALNQIGTNQILTAPATSFWPPFVPNCGCCC